MTALAILLIVFGALWADRWLARERNRPHYPVVPDRADGAP